MTYDKFNDHLLYERNFEVIMILKSKIWNQWREIFLWKIILYELKFTNLHIQNIFSLEGNFMKIKMI